MITTASEKAKRSLPAWAKRTDHFSTNSIAGSSKVLEMPILTIEMENRIKYNPQVKMILVSKILI